MPNRLAVRFDTASITKPFTAVAALQLVDEGRLELDTPITEIVDLPRTRHHLPNFAAKPPNFPPGEGA
ncbi:serine hydrolase domain-containing protein [Amycolatopsis sp. A1MSW2902]|uniref:serine hydrolase domain-containing protein n=1 Tax=Amycolatopsis sp. A1MSW2902 TaxID=687413 RepID=UPI00307F72AD